MPDDPLTLSDAYDSFKTRAHLRFKRARKRQQKEAQPVAEIELDRDDALRYVTAEAKRLKLVNIELEQTVVQLRSNVEEANRQYSFVQSQLNDSNNRVTELEKLLEEATKPRTAIVPATDPLVEDLSFLGYPTPAAR